MENSSDATFLDKLKLKFELIFETCLNDLEEEKYNAPIFKDHIEYIDDSNYNTYFKPLKGKNQLTFIVRDYIAGMSDAYFSKVYNRIQKN